MNTTYYVPQVGNEAPLEHPALVNRSRYRVGDLLQCLLVSFGLFGQQALVLAATGLQLNSRVFTVPARALVVCLALSVFLALLIRPAKASFNWPVFAFIAFWAAYGIRVALEAGTRIDVVSETGRFTTEFIATMAGGACFLPGLAILINSCWGWHRFAWGLSISLAAIAASAMLIFYGGHIANFEHRMSAGQDLGEVSAIHPLALGYLGAILSLFALHSFCSHRLHVIWRIILSVSLGGVGAFLLVGSASRGPMLAVTIAGFVLVGSHARRFDLRRLLMLVFAFVVISIGLVALVNATGSTLFDRLMGLESAVASDSEGAIRLELYENALANAAESPLFGKSITVRAEDGTDMYPHNIILESLVATGMLGTVPLLFLVGAGLGAAWRILTRMPDLGWIPILFIMFLTGAMFSGAIFSNVGMWIALASTLSCDSWMRKNKIVDGEGAGVSLT